MMVSMSGGQAGTNTTWAVLPLPPLWVLIELIELWADA
jgi:hypothetical protein